MDTVPVRIGYVLNIYPRLSETFILQEILELERRGAEVTIFALRRPDEGRFHPGVTQVKAAVHYLDEIKPQKWWRRLGKEWPDLRQHRAGLWALVERMMTSDAPDAMEWLLPAAIVAAKARALSLDALHAHFANTSCSVAFYAHEISGIPFSFTAHAKDIFTETVDAEILSTKLSSARYAITVSEYNKQFLMEKCPSVDSDQIHVLYNGVDLDFFSPATGSDPAAEKNVILGIGRLVPKKGFADMLRACALLKERGVDFACYVIGQGREEPALHALADELNLGTHVRFLGPGHQAEVRDHLRNATLLCQPCVRDTDGNQDALPTVLLESLACGIPVVSTRLAGIPEIVEHEREGLLVEPGDIEGLANAMARLLAEPALRKQFAQAGRAKAETRFSLKTNVARLHALHSGSGDGRGMSSAETRDAQEQTARPVG